MYNQHSCSLKKKILINFTGLIQFEGSGNWPDDLTAIKHIRTAFHIKVAECIRKELKIPARANPKWIDIFKVDFFITLQFTTILIDPTMSFFK